MVTALSSYLKFTGLKFLSQSWGCPLGYAIKLIIIPSMSTNRSSKNQKPFSEIPYFVLTIFFKEALRSFTTSKIRREPWLITATVTLDLDKESQKFGWRRNGWTKPHVALSADIDYARLWRGKLKLNFRWRNYLSLPSFPWFSTITVSTPPETEIILPLIEKSHSLRVVRIQIVYVVDATDMFKNKRRGSFLGSWGIWNREMHPCFPLWIDAFRTRSWNRKWATPMTINIPHYKTLPSWWSQICPRGK